MNKDINKTLMALVPILRMNGENVTNIEAVHDWYKAGDREYMKEVAEITYDNGTVRYADIGCDSNLTAIYDVIAVIQQIKPRSEAIERIERGVYSLPSAQPEEFEWCHDCKEYDQDKHYCHRWTKVIRQTVEELKAQPKTGKWIEVHGFCTPGGDPVWACSECGKGIHVYGIEHGTYGADVSDEQWKACPNCGAMMKDGEEHV